MRTIEIRDAVVPAVVIRIRQDVRAAAPVIRRPRERIRDTVTNASRRSPLDLRLEAVVLGPARRLVQRDAAIAQIGAKGVGVHARVSVSYTHLRAHETPEHLVCRLL